MEKTDQPTDYRKIFDNSLSPVVVFDTSFSVVNCNQSYEKLVGLKKHSMVGRTLLDALNSGNEEQNEKLLASFRRVIKSKQTDRIPCLQYDWPTAGESRFWAVVNTPILDDQGNVEYILNQPSDITELVNLKSASHPSSLASLSSNEQFDQHMSFLDLLSTERARIQELFQQAPGFVCILSGDDYRFEMANQAYTNLVGQHDIIGKIVVDAIPKVEEQGLLALLDEVRRSGQPYSAKAMEFYAYPEDEANPRKTFIDFVYQPIIDTNHRVTGIFVQGHDVTEAHNLTQTVSYQATHDPLTGLFNRRELQKRSTELDSKKGSHALIYLDLDHFKIINDRCGHNAGDELLVQVADALQKESKFGFLSRVGGDEFIMLIPNCNTEQSVIVAERLSQRINDIAFFWDRNRYSVTASIGIAEFGSSIGISYSDALSFADSACFLAKDKGRNRIQVSHPNDADIYQQMKDMDWVSRLKEAMREDRIVLYAQDIVALSHPDTVCHKEILSRLVDVDGTLVPPGSFITAAERFGLIEQLDRHIIRKVCQAIVTMQETGEAIPKLFINTSGITLSNPSFKSFIEQLLVDFPTVEAENLCLEVTETAAVANLSRTAEMMQQIAEIGINFALDDFGSGVATFNYLDKLPIKYIKIDGGFITNILTNQIGEMIVQSIQNIARVMDVATIAECIEDKALISHLQDIGIDYGQGYAIHKPAPLL
ncbi:sensor domain-containing protein [Pseudidiomarina sp. E22-M8]|uniref:sensor domain-containing protein n=1 Tax=Pseudidiomarina sp. E22-M8 TaxID=3424768 RepID=UPI00403D050E